MKDEFEYDVAFSFTAQDEPLATELNNLISGRLKTFIYSEHQKEIAGTDGQITFSEVYGRKARIVVVLFRKEWGNSPWTKVECLAVRNRAFTSGFDFTIFIPTENNPELPTWFPKTQLYVGLERWGMGAAAAAIEQRVAEAGGVIKPEDIESKAQRLKLKHKLDEEKHRFEHSSDGVNAARAAYEEFSSALKAGAEKASSSGLALNFHTFGATPVVHCSSFNMICGWRPYYSNSLENIFLEVGFWKGHPQLPGVMPSITTPKLLVGHEFKYTPVSLDRLAYIHRGKDEDINRQEFTPKQLAEYMIMQFMDFSARSQN